MEQVIRASLKNGKLIALDGDLGRRSYDFLDQFANSIHIKNIINFNDMVMRIKTDRSRFEQQMIADLLEGKKLFIPCMPNTFAEELRDLIKKTISGIRLKLYNSITDDEVKEYDIKNIINVWSQQQCVITTPTVEAGVSFDKDHFDKIYGVIADGSCCQTAFFQMTKRVRKVKCKEITILNYSKFKLNSWIPWSFDEVKEGLLFNGEVKPHKKYVETTEGVQINRESLNSFQINYIHNKVVELNKQSPFFLSIFKHLALQKGYKFIMDEVEQVSEEVEAITLANKDVKVVIDKILHADNLMPEDYEQLLKKQRSTNITEAEKLQILKHVIKKAKRFG